MIVEGGTRGPGYKADFSHLQRLIGLFGFIKRGRLRSLRTFTTTKLFASSSQPVIPDSNALHRRLAALPTKAPKKTQPFSQFQAINSTDGLLALFSGASAGRASKKQSRKDDLLVALRF